MAKTKKVVRFIQPRELPSMIWDADNNCPLVEFKQWTFSTSDPKVIKQLTEMGYPIEGVDQVPAHLHPEGEAPAEPIIVPDKKQVPPRPAHVPTSEAEDLATAPKPAHKNKEAEPKRKLKRKLKKRK